MSKKLKERCPNCNGIAWLQDLAVTNVHVYCTTWELQTKPVDLSASMPRDATKKEYKVMLKLASIKALKLWNLAISYRRD